jgi:hypothetical protein
MPRRASTAQPPAPGRGEPVRLVAAARAKGCPRPARLPVPSGRVRPSNRLTRVLQYRTGQVILDYPQVPGILARVHAVGRSSPGPLRDLPTCGACPPDLGSAWRVGPFSKSCLPYFAGARRRAPKRADRVISENRMQGIKAAWCLGGVVAYSRQLLINFSTS